MDSLQARDARGQALAALSRFRQGFYECLTLRADALFEATDAVLCSDGPVLSLPELSMVGTHRRGHGARYDALACGQLTLIRLRSTLAGLELPRGEGGRLTRGIDITPWPRPDAECSPDRRHCHRQCRCNGKQQTIPGWPYSVAAALGRGRSSWTAPWDVVRLGPDEVTEATAAQIRDLIERLDAAGQSGQGDPPVVIVLDAGSAIVRLTWLLRDLPVHLLGRLRSDRVRHTHAPAQRRDGTPGRRPRHGEEVKLAAATTHPAADQEAAGSQERFGQVRARAWARLHPKLERRAWADHVGPLPIVEGSVVHLAVEPLPGNRQPKPLWLWSSEADALAWDVDLLWRTYLRRFDGEHTFRFWKQTLGLTRPRLRSPQQADRWVWLLVVAYTQLRLARHLTVDLRHPWERSLVTDKLTPGRVRRGFRRIRRAAGNPASAPKASRPGPGRPKGRCSTPASRYPVGKKQRKADMPRRGSKKQASQAG
jgi:hypothetical protein